MAKKTNYTEDTLTKMGLVKGPDGTYYRPKTVPQPRDKNKKSITYSGTVTSNKSEILIDDIKVNHTDSITFSWAGEHISLNQWYSSKHWTHRHKQRNYWHDFFKKFLIAPHPKFEAYAITLECNSSLDLSNTITMIKLAEDVIKELGIIKDDSQKYCKKITILHDENLKKKSYKLTFNSI